MLKCTSQIQLGYYEPGHGSKGKKRYITDDDIEEMKVLYKKKKEVLLWCYDPFAIQPPANTKKRQHTSDTDKEPRVKSRSRFESALEKKMTKVEEVFESLQKKHSKSHKPEQLRAWANMIQMQKHASLGEPPLGRFFKTTTT